MADGPSVQVFFTPAELGGRGVEGKTAVVIDVLRATSCIVEAMANGAAAIFPTESVDDAMALRDSLDLDRTLLCGERKGLRIGGFDLGNSPTEFTPEMITDKQLIMTTTNGTQALVATRRARRTLVASLFNLSAVAQEVANDSEVAVVCAGKEGCFSLDDTVCAGHLVLTIMERADGDVGLDDGASAAAKLAGSYGPDAQTFAASAAGRALVDAEMASDLEFCAEVDRHDVVPVMHDRAIVLSGD